MLGAAQKHPQGFTLLELMIVIGIIAAITGFAIPNFTSYIDNQNLRQAQDQIVTDLRTIQNRALTGNVGNASPNPTYWGIGFPDDSDRYFFFTTENDLADLPMLCDAVIALWRGGQAYENSKKFPENIILHDDGTQGRCVYFSFENGNAVVTPASAADTIAVGYAGQTDECRLVTVNSVGFISALEGLNTCPN